MNDELGQLIAERKLACGKDEKIVTVRLGVPREGSEGVPWECPFQIVGLGESKVERAGGVDAFQALMIALEGIRVRLKQARMSCTWVGGEEGDPGFPRFVPDFFGAAFAARVNRQIDRELERFGKAIRSKRKK